MDFLKYYIISVLVLEAFVVVTYSIKGHHHYDGLSFKEYLICNQLLPIVGSLWPAYVGAFL